MPDSTAFLPFFLIKNPIKKQPSTLSRLKGLEGPRLRLFFGAQAHQNEAPRRFSLSLVNWLLAASLPARRLMTMQSKRLFYKVTTLMLPKRQKNQLF